MVCREKIRSKYSRPIIGRRLILFLASEQLSNQFQDTKIMDEIWSAAHLAEGCPPIPRPYLRMGVAYVQDLRRGGYASTA